MTRNGLGPVTVRVQSTDYCTEEGGWWFSTVCHIAATIKMTVLVRDAVIVLTLRPFASVQRKRSTQRSRLTFHGLLRHCRVHVNVTRDHIRIRYPLQVSRQVALSQWLPERRTTGPRSSGHVVGPAVAVVLFFLREWLSSCLPVVAAAVRKTRGRDVSVSRNTGCSREQIGSVFFYFDVTNFFFQIWYFLIES
jgi:hypothetical protein